MLMVSALVLRHALAFEVTPQNGQALMFGQLMSLAALIHALGIRINGYWRFSPLLRLAGMTARPGGAALVSLAITAATVWASIATTNLFV